MKNPFSDPESPMAKNFAQINTKLQAQAAQTASPGNAPPPPRVAAPSTPGQGKLAFKRIVTPQARIREFLEANFESGDHHDYVPKQLLFDLYKELHPNCTFTLNKFASVVYATLPSLSSGERTVDGVRVKVFAGVKPQGSSATKTADVGRLAHQLVAIILALTEIATSLKSAQQAKDVEHAKPHEGDQGDVPAGDERPARGPADPASLDRPATGSHAPHRAAG